MHKIFPVLASVQFYSQAQGVIPGAALCRSRTWALIILVDPFQLIP